jgi:apolipoprotein N-acyltransferase
VLAYVGFGVWPLAFVFVLPLWWALVRLGPGGLARSAGAGALFGAVAYAGGFAWLLRLVDVFLAGDRVLGVVLWLVHGLGFVAGFAAYGAVFAWVRRRGASIALAGVAPLLVLEWVQVQIFPVHCGNALVGSPVLVQTADLGGPLGLSAFVLGVSLALFETAAWLAGERRRKPIAVWAIAGGGFVFALAYGAWRLAEADARLAGPEGLRVGVVQANLGVADRGGRARVAHSVHVSLTRSLLEQRPLDLVVWPESAERRAIRGPLPVSGAHVREDLDVPLLFGGTLVQAEDGRVVKANAAFLASTDGLIRDAYEKNLLIPLAEWVPGARWLPALAARLPHAQDYRAATAHAALRVGAVRIATPICYEVIRPGFVRRMMAATDADLIVTLANDAWFGDSQEPLMHLQLARLRAVEHRRALVRATNSGLSALIDSAGRIRAQTGLDERTVLAGVVHPAGGRTLYARIGDWPGWLAAVALVAACAPRRRGGGVRRPAAGAPRSDGPGAVGSDPS